MVERGRSREPRESDLDDDDSSTSYASYDSADDDESYEDISKMQLAPVVEANESTEYESGSSYSSASESLDEPPTPDATEYESYTDEFPTPMPNGMMKRRNAPSDSSGSEDESDEFEDETDHFDGDSNGEFAEDDTSFGNNDDDTAENNDPSDNEDSRESGDDTLGEEIQLGKQDDDLFWKRYGYSERMDSLRESGSEFESTPFGDNQSNGSDAESDDESDFDDGETFKDELYSSAFPSIARHMSEDDSERQETKKESGGGGSAFVEKIKVRLKSCFDFSGLLEGNFKWYLLGAIILLCVAIVLSVVLGGKKDKDDTTKPPTAAPLISSPPTLPQGQVMEKIGFYARIPNGKEDDITEEDLELEFSAAFDILAPQLLLNGIGSEGDIENDSSTLQENKTAVVSEEKVNGPVRLRRRRLRRHRLLEALSVKLPIPVTVVEILCPETVPDPDIDLCVRAAAEIIVITDNGNIGFDFKKAMEVAIEDEKLQVASDATGSNLTIIVLEEGTISTPSPTKTPSPTISPRPTISSAPTSSCYDRETSCDDWANLDPSECDVNPEYMGYYCAKACGLCVTESPTTVSPNRLPTKSPTGSPTTSTSSVDVPTISSSNLPTVSSSNLISVFPTPSISAVEAPSISAGPTPTDSDNDNTMPTSSSSACVDKNDECAEFFDDGLCLFTKCTLWTTEGECDSNPIYMLENCAKSCDKCDELPTVSPTPFEDLELDSNLTTPSSAPTNATCVDNNSKCPDWEADDQCSANPEYMLENCKLSCGACQSTDDDQSSPTSSPNDELSPTSSPCDDKNDRCAEWATDDQCSANPGYMLANCKLSCNDCETEDDGQQLPTPSPNDQPSPFLESCTDNNDRCAEWAADDECSSNPGYMLKNCKSSCDDCENKRDEFISTTPPSCNDDNDRCPEWAADDQCSFNPGYMLVNCKASCGACEDSDGTDADGTESETTECIDSKQDCYETSESGECLKTKCAFWAQEGECEANPTYMLENCSKSCGKC